MYNSCIHIYVRMCVHNTYIDVYVCEQCTCTYSLLFYIYIYIYIYIHMNVCVQCIQYIHRHACIQ